MRRGRKTTERYQRIWQQFCRQLVPSSEELRKRAQLCNELWPEDVRLRTETADQLRENIFLFRLPWDMEQTVKPVCFGDSIDWAYFPEDDEEFTFQMNRHRYWICLGQAYHATGDEGYAECFVRQLLDWLEKEPLREDAYTHTWRTIEAGLRADYWVRAMALFARSPSVTDEVITRFLAGLEDHGKRLFNNPRIGFSMKSNWGVLEYVGLYILGLILDHTEYLEKARYFIKTCLHIQVMDDGMQWEASPMYHNEVLMCMMEALRFSGIYQDELFDGQELDMIRRMALVDLYLKNPEHHQPMVGDSDDTDVRDLITQAAYLLQDGGLKFGGYPQLDFESIWLYGTDGAEAYEKMEATPVSADLIHLRESGQVVLRSGWDRDSLWLYYINGPQGGGHGHSDKLHLSLWLDGDEILTDPGRYTYTDTQPRYALKNAICHNVPMVNRAEYAPAVESWSCASLPVSTPNQVTRKGRYTLIEGGHTGYASVGVTVNRRVLVLGDDALVICDDFIGPMQKSITQRFHFGEKIHLRKQGIQVAGRGETGSFCLHSFADGIPHELCLEESLFSRHYNELTSCPAADLTAERARALTTILARTTRQQVTVERVPVVNHSYLHDLTARQAEGYVITAGERRYGVVLLHQDVGNNTDLNGFEGVYGLGRTMVCDLNQEPQFMTVLQW